MDSVICENPAQSMDDKTTCYICDIELKTPVPDDQKIRFFECGLKTVFDLCPSCAGSIKMRNYNG